MYDPKSKMAAKKQVQSTKRRKLQSSGGGIFEDVERWVCPNAECNFLNKGSRIQCQVCKTQRKDQSVLWGDRAKPMQHGGGGKEVHSGSGPASGSTAHAVGKGVGKTFVHPLEAKLMGGKVEDVQPQGAAAKWNCPICTFANARNATKCAMCGIPKDGQ